MTQKILSKQLFLATLREANYYKYVITRVHGCYLTNNLLSHLILRTQGCWGLQWPHHLSFVLRIWFVVCRNIRLSRLHIQGVVKKVISHKYTFLLVFRHYFWEVTFPDQFGSYGQAWSTPDIIDMASPSWPWWSKLRWWWSFMLMTDEKSNLSIYDPFIVNIVLLNREGWVDSPPKCVAWWSRNSCCDGDGDEGEGGWPLSRWVDWVEEDYKKITKLIFCDNTW